MTCSNSFISKRRKLRLQEWGDSLKEYARSVLGIALGQNPTPSQEVLTLPLITGQPWNNASMSCQGIWLASPWLIHHVDSSVPHSPCSPGGRLRDNCLKAWVPVQNDSKQVSLLFAFSFSIWKAAVNECVQNWSQEYGNRGIIREPLKTDKSTAGHVEIICLAEGLSSPFRFTSVAGWLGFGGAVWDLTLELLLHCWFVTDAWFWKRWLPGLHATQNSIPRPPPSIPFPHAAWRWKPRMQNRKCAGDKERPRSHGLHRFGSGSQVHLSSMAADCLWNRCHPLLCHSLCIREMPSSRMGDNRH